jgi:hypothetical protein
MCGGSEAAVPNFVPSGGLLVFVLEVGVRVRNPHKYRVVSIQTNCAKLLKRRLNGTQNPPVLSTLGVRLPLPAPPLTAVRLRQEDIPSIAVRQPSSELFGGKQCPGAQHLHAKSVVQSSDSDTLLKWPFFPPFVRLKTPSYLPSSLEIRSAQTTQPQVPPRAQLLVRRI